MSTTDSPLLTTKSENTKTTTTAFVATNGENKKWKVIYFDFPARGEQLRLMFIYSKVDFIDERYKGGKLLAGIKKNVMGDASPLPYDQVPVLVSPDGKAYGQTAACMQLLGHILPNLSPGDKKVDATCLGLALAAEDLRNTVYYPLFYPEVYKFIIKKKAPCCCCIPGCIGWYKKTSKHKKGFARWAKHFEDFLRLQKTKYLAGNQLYYCDIAVFDSIEACLDLPCFNREKELKPFPILEQWYVEMGNIPHLKSYLEERGGRMEYVLKYLSKKK